MILVFLVLYFLLGTCLLFGLFFLLGGLAIGSFLGVSESVTMFVPAAFFWWLIRKLQR